MPRYLSASMEDNSDFFNQGIEVEVGDKGCSRIFSVGHADTLRGCQVVDFTVIQPGNCE